jgi:hypothetical protein
MDIDALAHLIWAVAPKAATWDLPTTR